MRGKDLGINGFLKNVRKNPLIDTDVKAGNQTPRNLQTSRFPKVLGKHSL